MAGTLMWQSDVENEYKSNNCSTDFLIANWGTGNKRKENKDFKAQCYNRIWYVLGWRAKTRKDVS